ncbi:hypothetical protein Mal48_01850 [Thalassoglobus polymorphus]|uniref:Uncharacterized protein n=2 Tax=Thalassoglobus polymorphus TaxID=2527994 RepID=A0A517QH39_9PLAN|nr:hypothetical protein Mal48_01400 [Thalassoglobus polymorphus]QDT30956.1 hypothetical protein Mal48_01850 [Thalassoglobus polymorphus]
MAAGNVDKFTGSIKRAIRLFRSMAAERGKVRELESLVSLYSRELGKMSVRYAESASRGDLLKMQVGELKEKLQAAERRKNELSSRNADLTMQLQSEKAMRMTANNRHLKSEEERQVQGELLADYRDQLEQANKTLAMFSEMSFRELLGWFFASR